ncbi:MAG: hypothetical protein AMJ75_07885 [Phycisphaerae bacterium SM1_79]|nr:MAG: hypothetical protein AMJ75_07885 [Phycisphaerae bacterium SM1_79]
MKRISILTMVVLVVGSSTAKARYYGLARYRTRWSIHTQGLISGDVRYSPYAFRYGHSGLVPGDVRYSPYAFSHKRSGLVSDEWCGSYGYPYALFGSSYRVIHVVGCGDHPSSGASGHSRDNLSDQAQLSYAEKVEARKERIRELRESRQQANRLRQTDGKQIIADYLRGKNVDFRTNRLLSIDGKTVSVDFLLEDRNIIIKYWNPAEIVFLDQKPEHKKVLYKNYLEAWKDFCGEYLRAGGKIFQIISADTKEISAKLSLWPDLDDGERMYALAQDRAATVTEP